MSDSDHFAPVYFWNPDGTWQEFLSPWYLCSFRDADGVQYRSEEMYMMYQKAITFNDDETAGKIIKAATPKEQKELGRQVKNFDSKVWSNRREAIVETGNYLKFTQGKVTSSDETLRARLLATVNRELVEASPEDRLWGIGFSAEDAPDTPRDQWGQNLCGTILTTVRTRLQREEEHK